MTEKANRRTARVIATATIKFTAPNASGVTFLAISAAHALQAHLPTMLRNRRQWDHIQVPYVTHSSFTGPLPGIATALVITQ